MIKILNTKSAGDFLLSLEFSNGETRQFDGQAHLADRHSSLLTALSDRSYFQLALVDAGPLCWLNGLELFGHRVFELTNELSDHGA